MIIERTKNYSEEIIDDLIERAFCEGYEYAQREFTDPWYMSKSNPIGRAVRNIKANNLKQKHSNAQKLLVKEQNEMYNNKLIPMYKNIERTVKKKYGTIGSDTAFNEINKNSRTVAKAMNQKVMNNYLDRIKNLK